MASIGFKWPLECILQYNSLIVEQKHTTHVPFVRLPHKLRHPGDYRKIIIKLT